MPRKSSSRSRLKQSKLRQQEAKEIAKMLRPFVKEYRQLDLRKPIKAKTQKSLRNHYAEYLALTVRPTKIYRARNPENLRIAQEFAQHDLEGPKFDVAFIPTADPDSRLRIRKRKNKPAKVTLKHGSITEEKIPFNKEALATDYEREVKRVTDQMPEAGQFIVICGEYNIIEGGESRDSITREIHRLMSKYSPGGKGYEKRGENSHWNNWLWGLMGLSTSKQLDATQYRLKYRREKEELKKKNRGIRRKHERQYGKRSRKGTRKK